MGFVNDLILILLSQTLITITMQGLIRVLK